MATTVINLSNLDGSNGLRLDRVVEEDFLGSSVSSAGDINGDGFDDVIIGALGADPSGSSSGSSYVVFGKASGFEASMNLSSLDGANGFRLDGVKEEDTSGLSVSSAGDVNGDGFDDLIIGAPRTDPNGYGSGSCYVVFGKSSGFDASLGLFSLDGNNGFRLDGLAISDFLGKSVSSAGDMNGDGFDDIIVGADGANSNGKYSGSSYVIFGKASGFEASVNLSSLNGDNGFRLDVEEFNASLGWSVSSAGDVNADGFDDLIIGAPNSIGNAGLSYVVFGKASGFDSSINLSKLDGIDGFRLNGVVEYDYSGISVSDAGDVNGDGFGDVIIGASGADPHGYSSGSSYVVFGKSSGFDATLDLSSLDGNNGFRMDGLSVGDGFGNSVSSAGDINGDGFDDLIIGSLNTGYSFVVFGKNSGFDATLDLANLKSDSGFRLDEEANGDCAGRSVSNAGDVNGDDFDDLIIGAPWADSNSGSTYIVFGRSNFDSGNVIKGTTGDDILTGTPGADNFAALDGNDNLSGRGGADIFNAGAGNDKINVIDLNFASVDGSSGNDVLHTDGKNLNLDLTDYLDKIQGIETICLYGRGDNTLTLTGVELKELSDTTNTLKVHGNAGDQVILEGNWVDGGSHGFYHTYTQDDAVLLVGMNMTALVA